MPQLLLILTMVAIGVLLYLRVRHVSRQRREDERVASGRALAALSLRTVQAALNDEATNPGPDPSTAPVTAIALLDASPMLSIEAIANHLARQWPELGPLDLQATSAATDTDRAASTARVLSGVDFAFSVELTARDDHLAEHGPGEGPSTSWSTGNQVWQDAAEAAAAHVATVVVKVRPTADEEIETAVDLSKVVAALAATCPQVSGAVWTSACHLISRRQILADLGDHLRTKVPTVLWINARVWSHADGRHQGHTRGLAALGYVEFEAPDSPESLADLHERLISLANYSLTHLIRNYDTAGYDDAERIKLRKLPSETGLGGWVFQLRYLNPSPHQPWRR